MDIAQPYVAKAVSLCLAAVDRPAIVECDGD